MYNVQFVICNVQFTMYNLLSVMYNLVLSHPLGVGAGRGLLRHELRVYGFFGVAQQVCEDVFPLAVGYDNLDAGLCNGSCGVVF